MYKRQTVSIKSLLSILSSGLSENDNDVASVIHTANILGIKIRGMEVDTENVPILDKEVSVITGDGNDIGELVDFRTEDQNSESAQEMNINDEAPVETSSSPRSCDLSTAENFTIMEETIVIKHELDPTDCEIETLVSSEVNESESSRNQVGISISCLLYTSPSPRD